MSWNPMMGGPLGVALAPQSPDLASLAQAFAQQPPMGGGLPQNTLGASGVTLGNPQAQDQYAEMAQALAQQNRAQQQQDMAAAMMQPKYAENSGGLGSLAMIVQAYAGKKLAKRADENDIQAREKFYLGEEAAAERKAQREAEREAAGVARKMEIIRRGDQAEMLANGIELPKGERGVPMMTDQGLVIVDPYSGGYRSASPEGQQQRGTMQGRNGAFNVSDDLPPEVRAQIIAAEQGNGKVPDDLGLVRQQPQQRPLMPYRDPEQAQRQAAADARAERADQRAERSLQFQQGQAADTAAERERKRLEDERAANARQAATTETAQDLIGTIDSLRKSDGYVSLGTVGGDIATNIPWMRTDAKDAQKTLDTISGKVALSTMAQLKALSAQGATGFGALNKEELTLLRNSISALEAGGLSHEALDKNLGVVRSKMEKIAQWQSGSTSPASPNTNQPQRIRIKL